jgi:hypothetical protein
VTAEQIERQAPYIVEWQRQGKGYRLWRSLTFLSRAEREQALVFNFFFSISNALSKSDLSWIMGDLSREHIDALLARTSDQEDKVTPPDASFPIYIPPSSDGTRPVLWLPHCNKDALRFFQRLPALQQARLITWHRSMNTQRS